MKKTLLMTAASLLAIETAYAIPGRDRIGDEGFSTVSLRSTHVPRSVSEKGFSDGFEYRWQIKANGTPAHSVRRTAEEKPYVDLRALLRTNPAMLEDTQYSVKFSEADIAQILDLYRTGNLQLNWDQDGLAYQQYCVHPLDGFHTLAVTSSKGKTYYKQQRWNGEIGNSCVIDVFADSKSQLEYRFDPGSQQWLVEGRKGSPRFSDRENAVKALKKLGFKYELKDRAKGEYSSDPFYSFADPSTRWALDEVERAKDAAYKPSLWKTVPMGWLALTGGGLIEALRYGFTTPSSQPIQPEETTSSKQSSTVQGTSYSVSSLTDLVARATPYAVTPVLLSMVSSSKSGLRSPLGILSAFGLGGLGSVAAQYMTDDQPEDGYIPPMGPVFQITQGSNEHSPVVAALEGGNPLVVWFSGGDLFSSPSMLGCVVNGTQCSNGQSFTLDNTVSFQSLPVVTGLFNGNGIVIWERPSASGSWVFEITVNETGRVTIPQYIGNGSQNNMQAQIATLNSGAALALWANTEKSGYEGIYGRRINQTGLPIDREPFLISNFYSGYSVNSLSNGNAFITAQDSQNSLYGYITNGNQTLSKFSLNASGIYPKSITVNGTNTFVSWIENNNIVGELLDESGIILKGPYQIAQSVAKSLFPSIASLTNGNLFISWSDASSLGSIYGQIINPRGYNITSPFLVSKDFVYGQHSVTTLNDGHTFVTWSGLFSGSSCPFDGSCIYGRIIYTNQTQGE